MSSVDTAVSGDGREKFDNVFVRFWKNYVRGVLFGVLYAMAKENSLGSGFMIANIVFEFLQMTVMCFRDTYHWGGIRFNFSINASIISYEAYKVIFWIVIALLSLAFANAFYIGYTFYKGEVRSIHLLRLLRWGVSLFISVLFIPILFILFSGLACDYTTIPASLLLYPAVPCWGDHAAMGIVAIAFVCVFSVISIVAAMTYYEHDPHMPRACAKPQNRFEFAAIFTKLVLIAVTVFLMDDYRAFAAVSFCSSLFLLVLSVVMLPFYNIKFNMARSGSYAGIFWVNVWMLIAVTLDNDKNMITTIAGTVGVPFAIAGGAFVAYRRFKYLCNPNLVDGYVSSEDSSSSNSGDKTKKSRKGVSWEPKENKLMKNLLYSRLTFPWDVEIASRFVYEGKTNAALLEKGKIVYQTGLSKFPKSPTVLQAYANFMFTTVGDWQLGYVVLEKLRKMKTMIDIQFFVYRYDKDRERRIEGGSERIGDFVDFMEYKKMQQAARRHHMTSLVCVRKFWDYLLEPKVDVMELSLLSGKIATAEKKAAEQYGKLLANHPKNVKVLRDYARFLEEVMQDESSAQQCRRKADKYENRAMEQLTTSHHSNSPEQINKVVMHGITSASDFASEIDGESQFVDDGDDSDDVSRHIEGQAKLITAKLDKHGSLKKLGYIMLATTIFVMVVALTELGVLNKQLANYKFAVDAQNGAGGAAHTVVRVGRGLADAVALGAKYNETLDPTVSLVWDGDYGELQAATMDSIIVVGNNLKALYWGTSQMASFSSQRLLKLKKKFKMPIYVNTSTHKMTYEEFDHVNPHKEAVQAFFTNPIYNETVYIPEPHKTFTNDRTYKLTDLWTMCSVFLSASEEVALLPIQHYLNASSFARYVTQFNFALENSPEIAIGMHALVSLYAQNVEQSLDQLLLTCLIIFIVAVTLLLFGSFLIFRPVVQQIFTSKVRTFTMFTLIPSSVVKLMSKKKISSLGLSDTASDDERSSSGEDAGDPNKKKIHPRFPKWNSGNSEGAKSSSSETKTTENGLGTHRRSLKSIKTDFGSDDEEGEGEDRGTEMAVLHTPRAPAPKDLQSLLPPTASDILGGAEPNIISVKPPPYPSPSSPSFPSPSSHPHPTHPSSISTPSPLNPPPSLATLYPQPSSPLSIVPPSSSLPPTLYPPSPNSIRLPSLYPPNPLSASLNSSIPLPSLYPNPSFAPTVPARNTPSSSAVPPRPYPSSARSRISDANGQSSARSATFADSPKKAKKPGSARRAKGDTPPDNENAESDDEEFANFHRKKPSVFQKIKGKVSSFGKQGMQHVRSSYLYKKLGEERERRPSRLDVSSLRAVTMKLHLSYLIAIGCIIASLCISYFLTRALLGNLVKIAGDLRNSDFRTQYGQVLALDMAILTTYDYASVTAQTATLNAERDFQGLWDIFNSIPAKPYQMDYMYTSECLWIDQEKCPKPGSLYYNAESYGFANLLFDFYFAGREAFDAYKKGNTTMSFDDPLYIKFRYLGETAFDGMEYLTFMVYADALHKIAMAKKYVAIISAIECIAFAFIYMTLFRPFVNQLREENNHTFSIIRMIPKRLLRDVPEIQEYIQETLESENYY